MVRCILFQTSKVSHITPAVIRILFKKYFYLISFCQIAVFVIRLHEAKAQVPAFGHALTRHHGGDSRIKTLQIYILRTTNLKHVSFWIRSKQLEKIDVVTFLNEFK